MGAFGLSINTKYFNLTLGQRATYQKTANGHEYWMGGVPNVANYDSLFKGGYTEESLMTLFLSVPEIFAPIHEIASRVMLGKYTLRNKKGEIVENDKLWNKLSNTPNWQETFLEQLYMAVVYKYVCGNRYFYRNVPTSLNVRPENITSAWVLPSPYVKLKLKASRPKLFTTTSAADIVEAYVYDVQEERQEFTPDVVYHDVFLNVKDGRQYEKFKGITPLVANEYPITNLVAVYAARGIIFIKHGALGFFVSKKSDADGLSALNPNEKAEVQKDFEDSYGITGGKSPIGITRQPLEFIRTGLSIKDLEPFNETKADAAVIYTALGVPTELMPSMERNNLDSLKNAERSLFTNKVIPEATELTNILTKWWGFDIKGNYIDVSFEHIEVLQENKRDKAETDSKNQLTYEDKFLFGQMTLNDMRALNGMEPVNNKLYNKLVFDMAPEELATVKEVLNLKQRNNGQPQSGQGVPTGN